MDARRWAFSVTCTTIVLAVSACASASPRPAPVSRGMVAGDSTWSTQPATRVEELFAGRFPGVEVFGSGPNTTDFGAFR